MEELHCISLLLVQPEPSNTDFDTDYCGNGSVRVSMKHWDQFDYWNMFPHSE